jgi:pSer/pThr/pTyr-binding forkhead associated (FHA) protein
MDFPKGISTVGKQPLELFLEACGATGPLQLGVQQPGKPEVVRRAFQQPFIVAGRDPGTDLPLDHQQVSRRHAYLQVIAGRLFCVDLRSRTGTHWESGPRQSGWLGPGQVIGIGPFGIRPGEGGDGGTSRPGPADDVSPLSSRFPGQDLLPGVALEFLGGGTRPAPWRMNCALVLVGGAPDCKVRIADPSVSRHHCSLVRTPVGVWVVDLLGRGGVSVNGARVRCARLGDGDQLEVGQSLIRFHCDPPPSSWGYGDALRKAGGIPLGSPGEINRLRQEHQTSQALPFNRPGQQAVESLARELEAVCAQRDRLQEEVQSNRAQLEASSANTEQVNRLAGQLDAAWAEREQLRAQRQADAREAEQLRARVSELEQSLAQAITERETARDSRDQALRQARAQWDAEQEAVRCQWEQEHRAQVRDAEQRLRDEQARAAAEREKWQEQLEAARREVDQERAPLQGEVERLRQEAAAWQRERHALLRQLDALGRERDELAAHRDKLESARREAEQRSQAEVARLTLALEQARQEGLSTARRNQESADQVQGLQAELPAQRGCADEHQQQSAAPQRGVAIERGVSFQGQQVDLDGRKFVACQFRDCVLVYRGGELPLITHCRLENCRWQFRDAAQRTHLFLEDVYHGFGEGGQGLVEATFRAIRSGTHPGR